MGQAQEYLQVQFGWGMLGNDGRGVRKVRGEYDAHDVGFMCAVTFYLRS